MQNTKISKVKILFNRSLHTNFSDPVITSFISRYNVWYMYGKYPQKQIFGHNIRTNGYFFQNYSYNSSIHLRGVYKQFFKCLSGHVIKLEIDILKTVVYSYFKTSEVVHNV